MLLRLSSKYPGTGTRILSQVQLYLQVLGSAGKKVLRLVLKWNLNPYFAYLACTRPCKSTDLQYIVHTYKVLENILAKQADLAR